MTKSDVESEGSKSPRHVREGSLKSVEEAKDTQETKSLAERKKLIIDRQKVSYFVTCIDMPYASSSLLQAKWLSQNG